MYTFLSLHAQTKNKPGFDTIGSLDEVIVTANKVAQKRSEAPVAISSITKKTIDETRAQSMDALLNKVSGVYNANLGNEQHSMSIRQPITTKSLFLYLEDGIPIRTTGVYNHNALLEMNLSSAERIEVLKGPGSSLYGAEAIGGVVNLITQAPPDHLSGVANYQGNNNGYSKFEIQAGNTIGKLGFTAAGYYAQRKNGQIAYSDFNKKSFSVKGVYKVNEKISWQNAFTFVDYYSDMTGALDSLKFAVKDFSTFHTFTYRAVKSLRYRSALEIEWKKSAHSSFTLLYRNNSIGQNPSYSVASTSNPLKYKGQINDNAFSTYAFFAQHIQKIKWLDGRVVVGGNIDKSPQAYFAKFIWINRESPTGKFTSYTVPPIDSTLNNYTTHILNVASFVNIEISPAKRLRAVFSLRQDAFTYNFVNKLPPTATSGGPSSVQMFSRFTPKLGFTYNINGIGFYTNYSQGYVPPQLSELFNSVKTPYLQPQTFANSEVGGWISLLKNKLYADWSFYSLIGMNEIISVRQADGSNINQNAGKTSHRGVEYGLHLKPNESFSFRVSGTNAKHQYVDYVVKGVSFNHNIMSGAPEFLFNAEFAWKPLFVKGFRISAEWQHQGKYYLDDNNLFTYKGFDLVNCRLGYQYKFIDTWLNIMNITNSYYATSATKSTSAGNTSYSYNLGAPREITLGLGFKF